MYFLQMSFRNTRHAGSGDLRIRRTGDNIGKWTILDDGPEGLELLQLIATACAGTRILPRLHFDLRRLGRTGAQNLTSKVRQRWAFVGTALEVWHRWANMILSDSRRRAR
jgi:hypothetical protein